MNWQPHTLAVSEILSTYYLYYLSFFFFFFAPSIIVLLYLHFLILMKKKIKQLEENSWRANSTLVKPLMYQSFWFGWSTMVKRVRCTLIVNLIGLLTINDDMIQLFSAKLRSEYQTWVCIGNVAVFGGLY